MKQDRLSLIAGFMPAAVLAMLLLLDSAAENGILPLSGWAAALVKPGLYLLLMAALRLLPDGEGKRAVFRFQGYKRQTGWFVLWMSLTAAVASILADSAVTRLMGETYSGDALTRNLTEGLSWPWMLAAALLTVVLEELFFRGVLFSALERGGTLPALLLTAVAFAAVEGSPRNLAGLLASGLIYGYLVYTLNSVWPALFAHGAQAVLALCLARGAKTYAALGVWQYLLLVLVFCLCLFVALAMRSLETQMEKGRIRRFQYRPFAEALAYLFMAPGMWLLALLYAVRILY